MRKEAESAAKALSDSANSYARIRCQPCSVIKRIGEQACGLGHRRSKAQGVRETVRLTRTAVQDPGSHAAQGMRAFFVRPPLPGTPCRVRRRGIRDGGGTRAAERRGSAPLPARRPPADRSGQRSLCRERSAGCRIAPYTAPACTDRPRGHSPESRALRTRPRRRTAPGRTAPEIRPAVLKQCAGIPQGRSWLCRRLRRGAAARNGRRGRFLIGSHRIASPKSLFCTVYHTAPERAIIFIRRLSIEGQGSASQPRRR